MITEDMVQRALAGERVYFLNDDGVCMLLWARKGIIRIAPQTEKFCEQ